ncbi:MAG: hypothetical protein H9535_09060 [Ignavibacteria bacterium]|nr:hypothetical protein [Ignavibacteria bacterium]
MQCFLRSFILPSFLPRTDARRRARILVDTAFIIVFIDLVHAVLYAFAYGISWHLVINAN